MCDPLNCKYFYFIFTDVLGFHLEKTGFMSAVPYLTMGILLGVSGYLADWAQIKGYLTTTQGELSTFSIFETSFNKLL